MFDVIWNGDTRAPHRGYLGIEPEPARPRPRERVAGLSLLLVDTLRRMGRSATGRELAMLCDADPTRAQSLLSVMAQRGTHGVRQERGPRPYQYSVPSEND